MQDTLLDVFTEWFATNRLLLESAHVTAQLSRPFALGGITGRSATLHDDNGLLRGNITVWTTGACAMEALDKETGHTMFWEHATVGSADDLCEALRAYIHRLHD